MCNPPVSVPSYDRALRGRLPLLAPNELTGVQRSLYDHVDTTMVPWADAAQFVSKTVDGRLVGPFNPLLFSPEIARSVLELQTVEARCTSLSSRVREVVILSVGAVWNAEYELYAHAAVARRAGLSDAAIRALAEGGVSEDLSDDERIAHRFTRQLTAECRVDDPLYQTAVLAFGQNDVVDMIILAGCYQIVCSLLNAFSVPAPV